MQDSKLDVTIGPYETYEDKLFGYKVIPVKPCATLIELVQMYQKLEKNQVNGVYPMKFLVQ